MAYINTKESKALFQKLLNSLYYVDKSELIGAVVSSINTEQCYLCITRPRRFGKSANARMLACFLSRGLDAGEMFANLKASRDENAVKHLGAHDVVFIDFSRLPDNCESFEDYFQFITNGIANELREVYPQANIADDAGPLSAFQTIYDKLGTTFCFVMDEWDSMFFEDKFSDSDKKDFLKFLKLLLKGRAYVELAYLTGILPIAKHSSGSELNMFAEYSAVSDPWFNEFFGFTVDEVRSLCDKHSALCKQEGRESKVDFDGLAHWYDGYFALDGARRFNPRSVVLALENNYLQSYWTSSGPYDEIYYYVKHNIAKVRDDLACLVACKPVPVNPKSYAAASMTLNTRDEILSAMIVYGFLTYHDGYASIPNYELRCKFEEMLEDKEIGYPTEFMRQSNSLDEAMNQIKKRDYTAMFYDAITDKQMFASSPLAVAIAWDSVDKKHMCRIEEC